MIPNHAKPAYPQGRMYRRFLSTYRHNAIRGEAWIRASRSHKHTDMREFTRFDRLAKISAIDAEARVVHSRSSINTRGSCKVLQSQLSFVPAYSCVFSFPVYCTEIACNTWCSCETLQNHVPRESPYEYYKLTTASGFKATCRNSGTMNERVHRAPSLRHFREASL
jgi:hypothetical protein